MRQENPAQGEVFQPRARRAALLSGEPQRAGGQQAQLVRAVFDEWLQHLSGGSAGRARSRARLFEAIPVRVTPDRLR